MVYFSHWVAGLIYSYSMIEREKDPLGKHHQFFSSFCFGALCGKVSGWIYNKMVNFRTREF
jgi:hypothetical protein